MDIAASERVSLNAGCGRRPQPGYINIDFDKSSGADVVCTLLDLPFRNASVSRIVCNHVLEHLNEDMWRGKTEISQAVLEFARVLSDDGLVEIEVPSPQGQDAVRGDHLTVYGHKRLRAIFQNYFENVTCRAVGTWMDGGKMLKALFLLLGRIDPFWGNAYRFTLNRPKRVRQVIRY